MSFKPVFLATDILFFALTVAIIFFVFVLRSKPHLKEPWAKVFQSTTGSVAMVVLMTYYSIAILDSLHFHPKLEQSGLASEHQYSTEVLSALDIIMTPMRTQVEKTFSAPLATQLYSKETIQYEDGSAQRVYPRLKYGGAHLKDPENDYASDIRAKLFNSFVIWLLCWSLTCAATLLVLARKRRQSLALTFGSIVVNNTKYPVRAVLVTVGVILAFVVTASVLGSSYHLFGTDKVGQDVFYQAIKSIRTGILIGALTTLVALPVAIVLGATAGYFKGWVDDVIQYLYTTLNSIPYVLLIAAAVLLLQVYMSNNAESFNSLTQRADVRLLFLCIILGITSWTGLCRLLRAETLKLGQMEYIQAATAFGVSKWKILSQHIMPNFMHIVLITLVLDFSGLVLAEAVLSYINIGVDPSMNSWGNMINQARLEMARDPAVWWSLSAALVFMFTLVLFVNLFADVVRDALDPRLSKAK